MTPQKKYLPKARMGKGTRPVVAAVWKAPLNSPLFRLPPVSIVFLSFFKKLLLTAGVYSFVFLNRFILNKKELPSRYRKKL